MSKKVSIKSMNDFLSVMDVYELPIEFSFKDKNISVVFEPHLSLSKESDFVNEMMSYVFDEDGEYHAEFVNIAFTSMLLKYLSNMTLPTLKFNKNRVNLNVVKDWDNLINFIDVIKKSLTEKSLGQDFIKYIEYLKEITDSEIEYLRNKSKSDILFEALTKLAYKYEDKFKDVNVKDVMDTINVVKNYDENKFVGAIVDKEKMDEKAKNKDNVIEMKEVKDK